MIIIEWIKKVIKWLIELIKRLFKKKKNKKIVHDNHEQNIMNDKKMVVNINGIFDSTLPVYMIINNNEKEKLIYSIGLLKNVLLEKHAKLKEANEKELATLIKDKCNIKVSEIIDDKYINSIVKNLDLDDRKEIVNKYHDILEKDIEFKNHVKEMDKVIDLINKNDITIVTENEIDREISKIINDKSIDNLDKKIDDFNAKVFEVVDSFDNDFVAEVIKEYKTVNFITIATTIIDKNYEKFKKLEEDYKNHRFNKYYYEREINKIKHELQEIKNLKNKKEVIEHIEKLKKELYTKSKDKYDLLYNNEVFIDINKRCDMLLDKINIKVVDIKKDEVKKEQEEKVELEEDNTENILLRFQDLTLSQKIILMHQEIQLGKINNSNINIYLNNVYEDFINGIDRPFNYERNKVKTELANLYNDLNIVISAKDKKPYINVKHANFLMEDLVNAVIAKKQEVEEYIDSEKTPNNGLVDEKLENIREKFIEKKDEKIYKKGGRKTA